MSAVRPCIARGARKLTWIGSLQRPLHSLHPLLVRVHPVHLGEHLHRREPACRLDLVGFHHCQLVDRDFGRFLFVRFGVRDRRRGERVPCGRVGHREWEPGRSGCDPEWCAGQWCRRGLQGRRRARRRRRWHDRCRRRPLSELRIYATHHPSTHSTLLPHHLVILLGLPLWSTSTDTRCSLLFWHAICHPLVVFRSCHSLAFTGLSVWVSLAGEEGWSGYDD